MAENVFSAARLRGYRVLQEAGLGDAADLLIRNTLIAGHLWLPVSLVEIAFRNHADAALIAAHPRGANWLLAGGEAGGEAGNVLEAALVTGPDSFQGTRDDGTVEDPIVMAARMASRQLGRAMIVRDDLVAHLMLGFWVVRVPRGLKSSNPTLDLFDLVADRLGTPLDNGSKLEKLMVNDILRIRNRLAHHEPLLFRAKHVFAKKTGAAKTGAALVDSLLGAIEKFAKETDSVLKTARAMAPMAAEHLDGTSEELRADVEPLKTLLIERRDDLRLHRDERRAARRS